MPDRRRVGRSTLPDQRTLLSWLFVGRLVLAVGILLGAGLVWTERPQESFLVTVAVVIALLFTGYGAWLVFVRQQEARQRVPDGAGAGGPGRHHHHRPLRGPAAVGLPRALRARGGGLRAAHAARVGRVTAICRVGALPGRRLPGPGPAPPTPTFWAQVVVFNVVFAIVAVLGHRLREAGMEQETLATELKRVRLEADDILRNIRSGVLTVDGVGRLAFINPDRARSCSIWTARG